MKKKRSGVNLPRPSSAVPAARARGYRRWISLALSAIIFLTLWRVDLSLKSHDLAGYAPGEVDALLASNDFADTWQALEASDLFERVMAESPDPVYQLILDARKATGIRWTPSRWRLWFGERLVVARRGDSYGLCVRPGVLVRAAEIITGGFGEETAFSGVRQWRGIAFGRRDGFLIASSTPEFVKQTMGPEAQRVQMDADRPGVHLHWGSDPAGRVRVHIAERIEFEGWLGIELPPTETPVGLSEVWPEEPMIAVSGGRVDEVLQLIADKVPDFPGLELVGQAVEELEAELPAGWADDTNEFSLALLDVDTSEFLAVPKLALVASGEGPLKPLASPANALVYNWSGLSGWMTPWLGEKLSTCVAMSEGMRIFSTQERVMASLAGNLRESDSLDADIAARIDITRLADLSQEMYRRAAEHELLPRMNAEDVERETIPLLDALRHFGVLYIEGTASGGGVSFSGELHLPVGEPEA